MSNKYDEKLAHKFFYSGYDSSGDYASAKVRYSNNIFYSYNTPIGVVVESTKVKMEDPDNPKGKKIPATVLLVEDDRLSITTSTHTWTLLQACPFPNVRILKISFPSSIRGRSRIDSRDIPVFYEYLCSKAISLVKNAAMTTVKERDELFRTVSMMEQFETFFGKHKKPKGYGVVTKMLNLIADEPRYAEYCKKKRKEMAAETRELNRHAREENRKQKIVNEKRVLLNKLRDKYIKLRRTLREGHDSRVMDRYKALFASDGLLTDSRPAAIAELEMHPDVAASPILRALTFRLAEVMGNLLYDPHSALCAHRCYWPSTKVYPDVDVRMDNNLKVTLNVNMRRMRTTRDVVVTTKEVRLFLKMRQRNESALYSKFKEGYRIESDWNNPMLKIGCHMFERSFVDRLQAFMLRPDEEILADYATFETNINNVLASLRSDFNDLQGELHESKQKTDIRQERLQKRFDREHAELECTIKAELEEQGLLYLW